MELIYKSMDLIHLILNHNYWIKSIKEIIKKPYNYKCLEIKIINNLKLSLI